MSVAFEDPRTPLVGRNREKEPRVLYTLKPPEQAKEEKERRISTRFEDVGIKLFLCKAICLRRKKISDGSLAMAVIGIILMIIETELTAANVISRSDPLSIVLKFFMTASTVALLISISIYYKLGIQVFTINHSIDNWRLALDKRTVITFLMEIIICVIHPIPGEFYINWYTTDDDRDLVRKPVSVPLDLVLSLPMFLRLYLVCRFIMLHSRLYQDASRQSLGALSRVHFNFRFIFKSFMMLYPDYFLVVFMLGFFIISSWMLRLCEMYDDDEHNKINGSLLNSMWLNAVTFLSVGYGDIVPNSYCGRGIVVITGIIGTGTAALVVAVMSRKLEMTHAEKCVHNCVQRIDVENKLKVESANVVKFGWQIYKYNKISNKTLSQERKLLHLQTLQLSAIHNTHVLKDTKRRLCDNAVTLVAIGKCQNDISASVKSIQKNQMSLEERITGMENTLALVYDKVCALSNSQTD